MASKSNTWCKKLMAKGKKHALGVKLGTFKKHSLGTSQDVTGAVKLVRKFNAPMVVNYIPKRRGSGARLSHKKRLAILEARSVKLTKREAFFAAI